MSIIIYHPGTYRVWCPDESGEKDARVVKGSYADHVAIDYVRDKYPDVAFSQGVRIHVRDPYRRLHKFIVRAVQTIDFTATKES